jgi:tripartite-type tricarboxylate transporter receptor subunit TctC
MQRYSRRTILGATFALPFSVSTFAQSSFPNRPVNWIVPFPAGGPADFLARLVTQRLSEIWGQSVIVNNKPGGNTLTATSEVVRAQPDGHTLLQTIDATLVMNPSMYRKLPYDPIKDFTHISMLAAFPLILVANQQSKSHTFEELVAKAKASPKKINCGFSTVTSQILVERFCRALRIELTAVPYKGTADLLKAMLSGEIETSFGPTGPYLSHFESGRIRALASSGPSRSHALPQVPTLDELGVKNIDTLIWHAISAPANLPHSIRDKIQKDVYTVLQLPEIRSKLATAGLEPRPSTPDEYTKMIAEESIRLAPVIKNLAIQLD